MGMKMMCDSDSAISNYFGRGWIGIAEVATHGINV